MEITSDLITVLGAPGSHYTRKFLAVLRYRRLACRRITRAQAAATDTTPLIQGLERTHPGRGAVRRAELTARRRSRP